MHMGGAAKSPNKRTVSPVQRRSVLSDNQLALVYLAVNKAMPKGCAINKMLVRRGLLAEARDQGLLKEYFAQALNI